MPARPAAALLAALLLCPPAPAADPTPLTVALLSELQERGPATPEDLAGRAVGQSDEAVAADAALNDWKLCVADAVARWSDLGQGAGTLIDGAFGRCGDIERAYRGHLVRIVQGGRTLMDLQFARSMIRTLEESWRARLTAEVLDQELARREAARPATPPRR